MKLRRRTPAGSSDSSAERNTPKPIQSVGRSRMNAAVVFEDRKYFYYDLDWVDAFLAQKEIPVSVYEFNSLGVSDTRKLLKSDLIFLLHSCDLSYSGIKQNLLKNALRLRTGKLIYFPRNEYKNFRRKRAFIKSAHVDLVASQLPLESATYLYGDLANVISLPHALNPRVFHSSIPFHKRKITVGGRSDEYPSYLLDQSRNDINKFLQFLSKVRPKSVVDYSTRLEDRLDRNGWSAFLGNCQFTIASEAGGIYVDKTDKLQRDIERCFKVHADASMTEARERFREKVKGLPSGKCISSRHFEAAGTRTCQILVEGAYSGILRPNLHYLELRADFFNAREVVRLMENYKLVRTITEEAYQLVSSRHTYDQRILELFKVL